MILYEMRRVDSLPHSGQAMASRQEDGSLLVLVLNSLTSDERKRAARRAVRHLLLAENRRIAAFVLAPGAAAAAAGKALARTGARVVHSNWAMAGGAVAGTAAMSTALVLGMHPAAEPHRHLAQGPRPGVTAPQPSPQAGSTVPGGGVRRGTSGQPISPQGLPASPLRTAVPRPRFTAPPSPSPSPGDPDPSPSTSAPQPSPSPSLTLLPSPTPTVTLPPLPHKHHHKHHTICVGLIIAGICVQL